MRTNLTADTYRRLFQQKLCFFNGGRGGESWPFGPFSGDRGDYSDVWMIKIMIKTNGIDMDICFFQKNITYKNHVCSLSPAFSHFSLLVCKFKPYRQTNMVPKIYKDLSALENLITFVINCFHHSRSTSLAVYNLVVLHT